MHLHFQLISKPGSSAITYEDIVKELEEMKTEKLKHHDKIKSLLNRLDESVCIHLKFCRLRCNASFITHMIINLFNRTI